MIEKLKKELSIEDFMCDGTDLRHYTFPNEERFMDKINEVIDHLNTQEEQRIAIENRKMKEMGDWFKENRGFGAYGEFHVSKGTDGPTATEVHLSRQLESNKSATASNQSNTEPADFLSRRAERSKSNTKITVKCKLCGKERDGIHLTCNCPRTISLDSELPSKIKLLKDRATYSVGEELFFYEDFYRAIDDGKYNPIHPDIIKATSGQGIRSEVTDGEESVSRTKEYTTCYEKDCPGCKHCEPSTPQTEPIESSPCTACYGKKQYTQLVTKNYGDEVNEKLVNELADCKRCNATGIEPSPPLESKYEERLKEKEMEGGLRGVPLETLPETLKQGEFMREMELEKRLESKYEDFGKELLEHLYETGHENRQVVGVLIDQIRRALKEF